MINDIHKGKKCRNIELSGIPDCLLMMETGIAREGTLYTFETIITVINLARLTLII